MIEIDGTVKFTAPQLETTIGSFKELKAQVKEAKNELAGLEQGTEAYTKQAAKVGNLTNEIDDLNKSVSALSGAPMENLTGSFGLLTNQVKNLDLKGAETTFKSLWATIAANPLIALATVLITVYQNWDKIKEVLGFTTEKVKDNTEELKRQEAALNKAKIAGEAYLQNLKDQYEILSLTNAPLAERLKAIKSITDEELKAADKNIAETKRQLSELSKLYKSNDELIIASREARDAKEKTNQEKRTAELNAILDQQLTQRQLIIARSDKQSEDISKERVVKTKEAADQSLYAFQNVKDNENVIARESDEIRAENALKGLYELLTDAEINLTSTAQAESNKRKLTADEEAKGKIEAQQRFTAAAMSLSTLYYSVASMNLQKGSKEEQEAAKKAFNLSKGLQLANAVISGIQGVQAAFTSGVAVPIIGPATGAAYAVAAGIVAAANIAKIAATKFTPSVSASTPATNYTPTSINIPTTAPRTISGPTTTLDSGGRAVNTEPIKVIVTEEDISASIQRVDVLESRAIF